MRSRRSKPCFLINLAKKNNRPFSNSGWFRFFYPTSIPFSIGGKTSAPTDNLKFYFHFLHHKFHHHADKHREKQTDGCFNEAVFRVKPGRIPMKKDDDTCYVGGNLLGVP